MSVNMPDSFYMLHYVSLNETEHFVRVSDTVLSTQYTPDCSFNNSLTYKLRYLLLLSYSLCTLVAARC